MVKLIVGEPEGAEDDMEVQEKTLLVSDRFFRGQTDSSSLAVVQQCEGQCG